MKQPREEDGAGNNSADSTDDAIIAELRVRLAAAPLTGRTPSMHTYMQWATHATNDRLRKAYITLVEDMLAADALTPREVPKPDRPDPAPTPKAGPVSTKPSVRREPRSYRARVHARMRSWHNDRT